MAGKSSTGRKVRKKIRGGGAGDLSEFRMTDGLIACHECDALHRLSPLTEHASAHCACCDARLYHNQPKALSRSLALHLAALGLFIIANSFPFISLKLGGRVETDMLLSGPLALFAVGMGDIGLLVLLTSIIFPLLTITAALYLLLPLHFGQRAAATGAVFRWIQRLMPWSLLGVFMLGVLIAIVKLLDLAQIEVGISLMAFAALLPVAVLAQQSFDSSLFWPHHFEAVAASSKGASVLISGRARQHGLVTCHTCAYLVDEKHWNCPRCDEHLHMRKPDALARTWALLVTASLLLIPANVLPIMTVIRFGQGDPSTILGGVVHLIAAGMWPLGLIVFFASIMVPLTKLLALVFLLVSVQRRSGWRPEDRTRLYRITEIIGSWSMVDIFIIGILTSLVSLDAIATIRPGIAASYFAAAVVVTMIAAQSFDPRLIWDALDEESTQKRVLMEKSYG